jgi:hypothetical protein
MRGNSDGALSLHLPNWPLSEQKPPFALLGNDPAAIGFQRTNGFLTIPVKSGSGIWFPTEDKYENCQFCNREKWPGRRAPFEPGLMTRKHEKFLRSSGFPK